MKILAIGDFHGKFPNKLKKEIKKADLILCTGDLGGSDNLLKIIFKYFSEKWWVAVGKKKTKELILEDYKNGKKIINELNSLGKKVYIINGNWDFTSTASYERTGGIKIKRYSSLIKKTKNLIFANRTFKKIQGLNVLFFGGSVVAGAYLTGAGGAIKKSRIKNKKKQNEKDTRHIMKHVKKEVDILFAHYPPYGYFDKVKYNGENPMNGQHVGFKGYTEFIKKNKPKLFICGHMHEYQGKKKVGDTLVIATGAAHDGKAVLIDFDKKKRKVKNVKFIK